MDGFGDRRVGPCRDVGPDAVGSLPCHGNYKMTFFDMDGVENLHY